MLPLRSQHGKTEPGGRKAIVFRRFAGLGSDR
jgi:hypothetical protein